MAISPEEVTRKRIANWILQASPIDVNIEWTEKRRAIDYGGHTYLVDNGQVFQCAHCGQYDPEWTATEVLIFFKNTFGIEPYEIEVTCTVEIKK